MTRTQGGEYVAGTFRVRLAELSDGQERWVIVGHDNRLHPAGSSWLNGLIEQAKSPHTAKNYGRRVASFLTWASATVDWRRATILDLRQWMRGIAASPNRSTGTVRQYMGAVRSFYRWADASGVVDTGLASRMTELKYFAPGTPAGGESGRYREILIQELRPQGPGPDESFEWIEDAAARQRLVDLDLNSRDRFLIDLFYYLGLRSGEALSLFKEDLHFGGGSAELKCKVIDPHLHIRMDNPTENGARSKGAERTLFVHAELIDRYVDYVIEKDAVLGDRDKSRHVFVNIFTHDRYLGRAMSGSGVRDLVERVSRRIEYPMSGPHVLRHTFATRLVRGIECERQDEDVVQALLGHRDLRSTRIYTHGLEQAKKAALESLHPRALDLFGGTPSLFP